MSLDATVVSLSQDMDLETGSMSNFMLVRLPNGEVIRALIDDAAAQLIVLLAVDGKGTSRLAEVVEEEESEVFGGIGEIVGDRFMNRVQAVGELETTVLATSEPPQKRPVRVDADELGYPIVHVEGGIDPRELTTGRDRDEDGVGQV